MTEPPEDHGEYTLVYILLVVVVYAVAGGLIWVLFF